MMRLLRCLIGGRRRRLLSWKLLLVATLLLMLCSSMIWMVSSLDKQSHSNIASLYMNNAGYDTHYQIRNKNISEQVAQMKANTNANSRLPKGVTDLNTKGKNLPEEPHDSLVVGDPQQSQVSHNLTLPVTQRQQQPVKANQPTPSQHGPDSLELLRNSLIRRNEEQRVLNADRFPAVDPHDTLVLIVQVHRREGYLKELLASLKEAKDIESVLMVISHDYYYDEIDSIVHTIDFCRVIQIFYPFSLQLFPDTFPGQSKNDCPRDVSKEEAMRMNCTNALYPDSFGHYREASVTAIKHHWWWKANMVFDGLRATADFSGQVLFLEEDHYVSPDFVVMAKKLAVFRQEKCSDCDFINMGTYTPVKNYGPVADKASVTVWNSGKYNMGFGMDRAVWNRIKLCSEHFCKFDDYNWDWSLNSLGQSCLHRDIKVILLRAPRIFHIGTCGMHHRKSCNENAEARKVKGQLAGYQSSLFPDQLVLERGSMAGSKRQKNYGGWGDVRDHELCLSFVHR